MERKEKKKRCQDQPAAWSGEKLIRQIKRTVTAWTLGLRSIHSDDGCICFKRLAATTSIAMAAEKEKSRRTFRHMGSSDSRGTSLRRARIITQAVCPIFRSPSFLHPLFFERGSFTLPDIFILQMAWDEVGSSMHRN